MICYPDSTGRRAARAATSRSCPYRWTTAIPAQVAGMHRWSQPWSSSPRPTDLGPLRSREKGPTVDSQVEFLECPAYVDHQGTVRCGLPAEVIDRFSLESTDGRLAAVAIVCPVGHRFNGVVDSLLL